MASGVIGAGRIAADKFDVRVVSGAAAPHRRAAASRFRSGFRSCRPAARRDTIRAGCNSRGRLAHRQSAPRRGPDSAHGPVAVHGSAARNAARRTDDAASTRASAMRADAPLRAISSAADEPAGQRQRQEPHHQQDVHIGVRRQNASTRRKCPALTPARTSTSTRSRSACRTARNASVTSPTSRRRSSRRFRQRKPNSRSWRPRTSSDDGPRTAHPGSSRT